MKKVLVIANAEKISPNANGGAAVVYSHIQLLSSLNYEVIVLAVEWNENYKFRRENYKFQRQRIQSLYNLLVVSLALF